MISEDEVSKGHGIQNCEMSSPDGTDPRDEYGFGVAPTKSQGVSEASVGVA